MTVKVLSSCWLQVHIHRTGMMMHNSNCRNVETIPLKKNVKKSTMHVIFKLFVTGIFNLFGLFTEDFLFNVTASVRMSCKSNRIDANLTIYTKKNKKDILVFYRYLLGQSQTNRDIMRWRQQSVVM